MAGGDEEQDQNHNYENKTIEEKLSLRRACIFIFFFTIGIIAFTIWLVYRPTTNPQFTLVGPVVYDSNKSSSTLLPTTMQFTIVAKNPNKQVSIYYDNLTASVLYKKEEIMTQVMLPPLFQEKKSTTTMSPMLSGGRVTSEGGQVWLRVVLSGRVRWKLELGFRAINIGYYELSVKCDVFVDFKKGGLVGSHSLPLLHSPPCIVDIH